ncbi:MAG: sigma-70 family RNA polymerase sigma factor [Phycisphaerales bacterium]
MSPSLLQRVAAGDDAAVRETIDRYGPLVWSLARRHLGASHEAEEVVQDIFVQLWQVASRFNSELGSEPTFVAMIARRRLIDRARSRARRPKEEVIGEAAAPPSADRLTDADDAAQAARALASLSGEQQRVIRLSVHHGLSHEEIATATGMPLGTVKTHIRRGLMRVRELLTRATDRRALA